MDKVFKYELFNKMIRDFAVNEVKPLAHEVDEQERFPYETVEKMAKLGLMGIIVPKEYGGMGGDYKMYIKAVEELSKVCATTGVILSAHTSLCIAPIMEYGNEEQKKKYLPKLASGEWLGAFGLTEPGAGSDAGSLMTKAVLEGDHFVINGSKTFITWASRASRILTIARMIENGEDKGYVAIIVPTKTPGLTTTEEHKMGLRGTPLNEVSYQDVVVPAENLLGKVGQGLEVALVGLNEVRTGCAAFAVGLAQEAIDLAVKYSKERMQFGKRISQFQNTQFVLAECQTRVQAARLLVYQAASGLDAGNEDFTAPAMAKYYASEVCNDVARKCLQVFGGYGYMKDYPIERIYRDAKIAEIFDGTSEVQKMLISKAMGVR